MPGRSSHRFGGGPKFPSIASPRSGAGSPASELTELDEDEDGAEENLGDLLSSPVGGGGAVGRLLAQDAPASSSPRERRSAGRRRADPQDV